jgi:hypothetical protein
LPFGLFFLFHSGRPCFQSSLVSVELMLTEVLDHAVPFFVVVHASNVGSTFPSVGIGSDAPGASIARATYEQIE